MTKFKTSEINDQALLDDALLETVAGGVKDGGCIPGRPIPTNPWPTGDWVFKDLFAKPTLGTGQYNTAMKMTVTAGGLDDRQIADIVAYLMALK